MTEPDGVSLRSLNLMAPDGLDCPTGGLHHIKENALLAAAAHGGGTVHCEKCDSDIELRSLTAL
jgi:hypothetical protein